MRSISRICRRAKRLLAAALLAAAFAPAGGQAAALHVGGATTSITPDRPVALAGQFHVRIASDVESPCTATALALEAREGERVVDQAVMVSCDLVYIPAVVVERVRERVKQRLGDFDANKLFLSATHTHTAPVLIEGQYPLPEQGIMRPAEYVDFLADRVADIVVRAWNAKAPGHVGWGLGHAVVAENRRAVYANGSAAMYGGTNDRQFRGLEDYVDHGVEVLCFWNQEQKLIATAINVACPAQEVEGRSAVNADFWHPVREQLRKRHGADLLVLAWTGTAGDQSPHLMFRKAAEERMQRLRGLTRLEELARRIVDGWEEAYAGAKQELHADVSFAHVVRTISLPPRKVTNQEYAEAQAQVKVLSTDPAKQPQANWHQAVVDRFERDSDEPYRMELHVIRLGDVAIATNAFELYTAYGVQMKARSPALQTFNVQLAGPGTYLPTARALHGGGYSAIVQSSAVGPEGGQVLVDETIKALESLWPKTP